MVYLQINMVKYDVDQEITIINENIQIVWSQFFPELLKYLLIFGLFQNYFGLSVFGFDLFDKWQLGHY